MKPLALLFTACLLSGIALPVPEDLPLLAAGVTVQDGWSFLLVCGVGALGVLCRDALFFALGRVAGEAMLRRAWVQRVLGRDRIQRARVSMRERGGRAVLAARVSIGFRSVSFLVAGVSGVRVRDFLVWDALGAMITVPVTVGIGALIGAPVMLAAAWAAERAGLVAALVGVLALAWLVREFQPEVVEEPAS